jgi:hypothetical protein
MSRLLTATAFVLLAFLPPLRGAAQEAESTEAYAEIPGTKISLRVPAGFALAEGFPGIMREELGSFVVVTEMPTAARAMQAGMTKEALETRGIALLRSEQMQLSGADAVLLHITQEEEGIAFRKWFLLFGDDSTTVMIAASAPQAMESQLGEILERCLRTAQWFPDRVVDPYQGMGFKLRESAVMEIRGRIPGGVLLTRQGAPDELSPNDPILVIYPSRSAVAAPLATFAKQELTETTQFIEFANFSERALTINGLSGYEIIADAKEAEMKIPVRIILVAVRSGNRDMVLEGVVAIESWDTYLAEFQGLAESFEITPSPTHGH